jgi:hypothetical protein
VRVASVLALVLAPVLSATLLLLLLLLLPQCPTHGWCRHPLQHLRLSLR